MKAVACHTDRKWVLLYVGRWLEAPMLMPDGTLAGRTQGTPQGGPISPLLANVFLHYGFDSWMAREYPGCPFERFADDAVIHCVTERQALEVRDAVGHRFAGIGLTLHPDKTKIVFCKDGKRRRDFPVWSFTFCGYEFRPRRSFNKETREAFTNFLPAAAPGKITEIGRKVVSGKLHRRTNLTLDAIAKEVNPVVGGWLAYFTAFYSTAVKPLCKRVDRILVRWAMNKYKRLKRSVKRAREWLLMVRKRARSCSRTGSWRTDLKGRAARAG